MDAGLGHRLRDILGADHVHTDARARVLFSQDVFSRSDFTVKAVLAPGSTEELAQAVAACIEAGFAVIPRGGGLSYTGGYLPTRADTVAIDTARLNRVLEINREDMYVRVEAGCSWADLHKALKGKGVRTPFWGTLSGLYATIGGSASQNSIFFGSGLYGTSAASFTNMKIITANGGAFETGRDFFRHYGPDVTGLFTGDCGALGIKAELTLRLIPAPAHKAHASFSFARWQDMIPAMSEVSRRGLASECFGFDPHLQAQRMKRESLAKDVKSLAGAMKASGSALGAIRTAARLARAGRGFMKDVPWSVHLTAENRHKAGAEADIAEIRNIMIKAGGTEIENAIPTLVTANPFMPPNSMIGPEGERWAPVHAIAPHTKAPALMAAIEALFEAHADEMDRHGITTGYLLTSIGQSAIVLEPVFFWPDALMDIHRDRVEAGHLKNIRGFSENRPARDAVTNLRAKLIKVMAAHGAAHLQIGKSYPYRAGVDVAKFALLKAIKTRLDPHGLINPGALGL